MPTKEREGLVRLSDRTEKAVIWKGEIMAVFDADVKDDQLWWIQDNDGPVFSFVGTGITEEDISGTNQIHAMIYGKQFRGQK